MAMGFDQTDLHSSTGLKLDQFGERAAAWLGLRCAGPRTVHTKCIDSKRMLNAGSDTHYINAKAKILKN